jgi:hypothetical protein
MREYYDKTYTGRKNTELLRDQMMEDYMVKKRMKRKIRNDFEDFDDFESEIVVPPQDVHISKSLILAVIMLLLGLVLYFNRRKAGKNLIYIVKDEDYEDAMESQVRKKRNK